MLCIMLEKHVLCENVYVHSNIYIFIEHGVNYLAYIFITVLSLSLNKYGYMHVVQYTVVGTYILYVVHNQFWIFSQFLMPMYLYMVFIRIASAFIHHNVSRVCYI